MLSGEVGSWLKNENKEDLENILQACFRRSQNHTLNMLNLDTPKGYFAVCKTKFG